MPLFLASVRNAAEARVALDAGADIIDAKEPEGGALGAVPAGELVRIMAQVNGERPVSATIGDLPMHPHRIAAAVSERGATGVDYVKVGFFDLNGAEACAVAACEAAKDRAKIVAVLFADLPLTQSLLTSHAIPLFAKAGVSGVMLDTANKKSGGLTHHLDLNALDMFIRRARAANLMSGLAGGLEIHDISEIADLKPDFMGFRGALCHRGERAQGINLHAAAVVRQTLGNSEIIARATSLAAL